MWYQCHVEYVKINQCCQLALDGVVDTDVDYTSNDAGSSPTYYLLFSFFSLSYKTPIKYIEWRWQSDSGVSTLVTTVSKLANWRGRVTAVHFILFNFANFSPSIAMELKVLSKEIPCKWQNQRFESVSWALFLKLQTAERWTLKNC